MAPVKQFVAGNAPLVVYVLLQAFAAMVDENEGEDEQ